MGLASCKGLQNLRIKHLTKPTKWLCAQRRLRSAWASAHWFCHELAQFTSIHPDWSESSLCAQWVAMDPSFLHADSEDSDQTGGIPRLIWVFAERTCHFVGFVMSWLNFTSLLVHANQLTKNEKEKKILNIDLFASNRMFDNSHRVFKRIATIFQILIFFIILKSISFSLIIQAIPSGKIFNWYTLKVFTFLKAFLCVILVGSYAKFLVGCNLWQDKNTWLASDSWPRPNINHMDRVKRIWYLSPIRAAKVQASLRIRPVSPEPHIQAVSQEEPSDRKPDP